MRPAVLAALFLSVMTAAACAAPGAPTARGVTGAAQFTGCAESFLAALVDNDAERMYRCSSGELRHRIDERADAAGRLPYVQLQNDLARRGFQATGEYWLRRQHELAGHFRLRALVQLAVYDMVTDRG